MTTPAGKLPAQKNKTGARKFNFQPRPDPNVMDVNTMTVDEKTELMRRGTCFKCKEVGHLSQDCKKTPTKFVPQKKQGYKDTHIQIKAIINALDKEDQAKFMKKHRKRVSNLKTQIDTGVFKKYPHCI